MVKVPNYTPKHTDLKSKASVFQVLFTCVYSAVYVKLIEQQAFIHKTALLQVTHKLQLCLRAIVTTINPTAILHSNVNAEILETVHYYLDLYHI